MPSVNTNREEWVVKNATRFPITIGDLPKVPAIKSGKILNLLRYATKQEIGQSKVLVDLLRARYLTLKKSVQNIAEEAVTRNTARESLTSVEKEELEAAIPSAAELVELRGWLDNVILGDNGDLDLGSGNLTTTGTIGGVAIAQLTTLTDGSNADLLHVHSAEGLFNHNDIGGLQGGNASNDEFYHLDLTDFTRLVDINRLYIGGGEEAYISYD